jgi:hypothetical protein
MTLIQCDLGDINSGFEPKKSTIAGREKKCRTDFNT